MKRYIAIVLIMAMLVPLFAFPEFVYAVEPINLWHSDEEFFYEQWPITSGSFSIYYDSNTQVYTVNGLVGGGDFVVAVGEMIEPFKMGDMYTLVYDYLSGSCSSPDSLLRTFDVGLYGTQAKFMEEKDPFVSGIRYNMSFFSLGGQAELLSGDGQGSFIRMNTSDYSYQRTTWWSMAYQSSFSERYFYGLVFQRGTIYNNFKFRVNLSPGVVGDWRPWVDDSISGNLGGIGNEMSNWGNQASNYEDMSGQAVSDVTSSVLTVAPFFNGAWDILPLWVWSLLAVSLIIVVGRKILGR